MFFLKIYILHCLVSYIFSETYNKKSWWFFVLLPTMRIKQWFLPSIWFFSGTTTNDPVERQNKLTTLSTEFTHKNRLTSNILPNSSFSPMARKTVENKHRTLILITVAGTFISTLMLVVIGFQLRSRMILCRREHNDQQNMFCENGNVYAEANNVIWKKYLNISWTITTFYKLIKTAFD